MPSTQETSNRTVDGQSLLHNADESTGKMSLGKQFEIPMRFTKSGRKKAVPFPIKLMKVLSSKEFEHIIAWMPSGMSFSIVDSKAFVADVLPEQFKSAKYASFTRKLHRWGFMRRYRGEESGAFYHKLFQKDRLDLVEQMTCHKMEPQAPLAMHKEASNPNEMTTLPVVQRQQLPPMVSNAVVSQLQQQTSVTGLQERHLGAAERLNAAIELEVARRLKERIQAAAVSRHTFALMNQLNQSHSANMPWNAMNGSLQAQLLQLQQQKQQLGFTLPLASSALKQQPGIGEKADKGLGQLPRTNIQGAKTA